MTGADLAKILQLPDAAGMPNEVILQQAHDVNFGGQISQMLRLAGAEPVFIGTANHCDVFHLRGAMNSQTAAILYVATGVVNPVGDFLTVEQIARTAAASKIPVIVDAAAEPDVRPYLAAGADLVITSAHKLMGAPTSGMLCGRKDLIRACYLQNWGIGRAMKVGKEGIAGCMAAVELWYSRDESAETARYARLTAILAERLDAHPAAKPSAVIVNIPRGLNLSARQLANRLREGDPPVWVREAIDQGETRKLIVSLVALNDADAGAIGNAIATLFDNPQPPVEDVPYHDLYWSEERLLRWPD
jgi:L-seryl-tRNA(Ser) seleniumtransferase